MLLKKGDRIRLKARTIGGWKGTGTVIEDEIYSHGGVRFEPDGKPGKMFDACRHEVAKLHDVEPVISAKVGDIRRRIERLERPLKRTNRDG